MAQYFHDFHWFIVPGGECVFVCVCGGGGGGGGGGGLKLRNGDSPPDTFYGNI